MRDGQQLTQEKTIDLQADRECPGQLYGIDNAGDQFVTVNIIVPEKLSPKERELYEELARIQRGKK